MITIMSHAKKCIISCPSASVTKQVERVIKTQKVIIDFFLQAH